MKDRTSLVFPRGRPALLSFVGLLTATEVESANVAIHQQIPWSPI